MHCSSCSTAVERALRLAQTLCFKVIAFLCVHMLLMLFVCRALPGVESASVALLQKSAQASLQFEPVWHFDVPVQCMVAVHAAYGCLPYCRLHMIAISCKWRTF